MRSREELDKIRDEFTEHWLLEEIAARGGSLVVRIAAIPGRDATDVEFFIPPGFSLQELRARLTDALRAAEDLEPLPVTRLQ